MKIDENTFYELLKDKNRKLCKEKKLLIGGVEKHLDLSSGYFSRDNTKPSIYECLKLCKVLDVSFNELFTVNFSELV